jgi:acetoin utilization protein AcuC
VTEPKRWALVWAGPIAADELDGLFPNMSERYPRTVENLLMDDPDSFEQIDPAKFQHVVEIDYIAEVHDSEYIDEIENQFVCEGAWEGENAALATLAGISFDSTIVAAAIVANGTFDVAYSLASGQHHAKRAQGGGFCAYNDVAGAARYFADQGLRPMIIDIDIHAGDGTQSILWDTEIPTVSVHAGSIFPSDPLVKDFGQVGKRHTFHWPDNHAYNFVLEDHAQDDALEWAMNEIDGLVRRYTPGVIVFVVGADGHVGTPQNMIPTAGAAFTYSGFDGTARRVRKWADEFCAGRILMTSAGGYQPLDHTPRIWANVVTRITQEGK